MNLTPEEKKVQKAVGELGEVQGSTAFRKRLGRQFVTGEFDEQPRVAPSRPRWQWMYLPAAAAAAAILVLAITVLNRGPEWEIAQTASHGTVFLDGDSLQIADLSQRIYPGATIVVAKDAELTLIAGETMVVQMTPGTEATIPTRPNRWYRRTIETSVEHGEIRLLTGPGFSGALLVVHTPESLTEVTGTTISVVREREMRMTCVCVMTGEAMIGVDRDDLELIPTDMRKVMFGDEREPMVVPIMPVHRQGLIPFVETGKALLDKD